MTGIFDVGLETALAWVYSRDSDLVARIDSADSDSIADTFRSYTRKEFASLPGLPNLATAWTALKSEILSRELILRGVSFNPTQIANLRSTSLPPREIPKSVLVDLELDETLEVLTLRPTLAKVSGEDWWRDNQIDQIDLISIFPSPSLMSQFTGTEPQKVETTGPDPRSDYSMAGWEKLSRMERRILQAYFDLRIDGEIDGNVEARNKAISDRLGGHGSTTAIYRAFRRFKEVFGFDAEV